MILLPLRELFTIPLTLVLAKLYYVIREQSMFCWILTDPDRAAYNAGFRADPRRGAMKKTALLIAFFVTLFLGYAQAQSQTQPQSQRFISPIPTKTVRLPVGKVDIDPPDI